MKKVFKINMNVEKRIRRLRRAAELMGKIISSVFSSHATLIQPFYYLLHSTPKQKVGEQSH